jgi:hypothetical protein
MSKHSPAPWQIKIQGKEITIRDADNNGIIGIQVKRGDNLWPGWHDAIFSGKYKRDAHLIAAAPDLYAACNEALKLVHQLPVSGHTEWILGQLLNAVEKAEGKD